MSHPLLAIATPQAWIEQACSQPATLLLDHANCEKKAASTALSLMFAYAEDLQLAGEMSRLAREELRHYEQVAKLLRKLKIAPLRLAPGRYAGRLRRLVATVEPQRAVDLMLCGAFIEARSCERFAALSEHMTGPPAELFSRLHEAEARHYQVYLRLADRAAETRGAEACGAEARGAEARGAWARPAARVDLAARTAAFAVLEASLIGSPDAEFRFHSGVPLLG